MKYLASIVFVLCIAACNNQNSLFTWRPSAKTGISFSNQITENDSVNPMSLEFLYNGAGVATGDFNNDGLPDLYFTASTSSNKLYLNKGSCSFIDITNESHTGGNNHWCTGASVIDINNDGWQDIYVCSSVKSTGEQRKNLLYINQGLDKNGVPVFKEMAAEYGLADTGYSIQAAFFDYDNDGDLDMYLVETRMAKRKSSQFVVETNDTNLVDRDKLFENNWNPLLKHPTFTDVSKQAGIVEPGFGLGITVADINKDGWKDIYVTNDFYNSDQLYINNGNKTFTNRVKDYFKHTSQNAMGCDIADINNDGLTDVVALDMDPENNYRKKTNMNSANYYVYQSMIKDSLELQYVRNTLQVNQGICSNGAATKPVFSEIGFYAGIEATDWSWGALLVDMDNDGLRDLMITNGYTKDITDHDFAAFRTRAMNVAGWRALSEQIPQIKIPNYAYHNKGNMQFADEAKAWGLDEPSFSNGAVAVDLDNDGDLDYVVNNINDEAFVYRNNTNEEGKVNRNFLDIAFAGDKQNTKGIGAWAEIYYGKSKQVYENEPVRGYLSCVDTKAFFGLDTVSVLDSVVIRWPNNTKQVLTKVKANQHLVVDIKNANLKDDWSTPVINTGALFTDVTATSNVHYVQTVKDYIDFDKERLLPHKLSQYTPSLAVGDVDGNGLDDVFVGGNAAQPGTFLLQQPDGKFVQKPMPLNSNDTREAIGALLFDADGDGDNDLWCANGSNKWDSGSAMYADQFYRNDGKGNFTPDTAAFPQNVTSKSCIRAADIDRDGDLDLFIGGRCLPGRYPMPVSSFIYRNDSKDGVVKFTDITESVCPKLKSIGMVCDAVWTDWDNDGKMDLIVAGEWMPLTFFKNENGKLTDATAGTGIGNQKGWWNSLAAGDFDNDGDIDYIAGNLGLNSFIRGSEKEPVKVYAKDFDGNGTPDAVMTLWLKDDKGVKHEYTAMNRDDIVSQMPSLKKKFNAYKAFAAADINQIFTPEQLKGAYTLEANTMASCFVRNDGNGKFTLVPLPPMAQMAPLNGMQVGDFNADGNLDVALLGNDYGNEVTAGRYDAMNGLVLLGDGAGNFAPQTILQSGFYVPGDAKALVVLRNGEGKMMLAASQNNGAMKVFRSNANTKLLPVKKDDAYVMITLANGKKRKQELYWGSSFLSASGRYVEMNMNVRKIEVVNGKGEKRGL